MPLALLVLAVAACGEDEEARDPGCELWTEVLANDPTGISDERAAAIASDVASQTEDDDVRVFAESLADRLAEGGDIQLEFAALSDACGLND